MANYNDVYNQLNTQANNSMGERIKTLMGQGNYLQLEDGGLWDVNKEQALSKEQMFGDALVPLMQDYVKQNPGDPAARQLASDLENMQKDRGDFMTTMGPGLAMSLATMGAGSFANSMGLGLTGANSGIVNAFNSIISGGGNPIKGLTSLATNFLPKMGFSEMGLGNDAPGGGGDFDPDAIQGDGNMDLDWNSIDEMLNYGSGELGNFGNSVSNTDIANQFFGPDLGQFPMDGQGVGRGDVPVNTPSGTSFDPAAFLKQIFSGGTSSIGASLLGTLARMYANDQYRSSTNSMLDRAYPKWMDAERQNWANQSNQLWNDPKSSPIIKGIADLAADEAMKIGASQGYNKSTNMGYMIGDRVSNKLMSSIPQLLNQSSANAGFGQAMPFAQAATVAQNNTNNSVQTGVNMGTLLKQIFDQWNKP